MLFVATGDVGASRVRSANVEAKPTAWSACCPNRFASVLIRRSIRIAGSFAVNRTARAPNVLIGLNAPRTQLARTASESLLCARAIADDIPLARRFAWAVFCTRSLSLAEFAKPVSTLGSAIQHAAVQPLHRSARPVAADHRSVAAATSNARTTSGSGRPISAAARKASEENHGERHWAEVSVDHDNRYHT